MRFFVRLVVILAVLWGGWWGVASYGMGAGISAWLQDRRGEGWQAEISNLTTAGFPNQITKRLNGLALADPDSGVALTAEYIEVTANALRPGDVTITVPPSPVSFATPDGRGTLNMADGIMTLNLHPGTSLELEHLGWTAGAWQVQARDGSLIQADALSVVMQQNQNMPNAYEISATAPQFQPGTIPRQTLRIPDNWPVTFDALNLSMDVTFDRPWDRIALEQRRPQPRKITLHLAEAAWADLRLNLAADLDVSPDGTPSGTLSIQARNWQQMLDLAVTAQILPPDWRDEAERALSALARTSGNPNTIDAKLTLRNGLISLGFLPLAPAPKLQIR